MSVFTYPPIGAQLQKKPRVLSASFGDGYTQRTNFGINANPQVWQLSFVFVGVGAHLGFKAFLDGLNGSTPFTWTPRGELTPLRFVCPEHACTESAGNVWNCTATFEQDFGN
jgi:phage-related protein